MRHLINDHEAFIESVLFNIQNIKKELQNLMERVDSFEFFVLNTLRQHQPFHTAEVNPPPPLINAGGSPAVFTSPPHQIDKILSARNQAPGFQEPFPSAYPSSTCCSFFPLGAPISFEPSPMFSVPLSGFQTQIQSQCNVHTPQTSDTSGFRPTYTSCPTSIATSSSPSASPSSCPSLVPSVSSSSAAATEFSTLSSSVLSSRLTNLPLPPPSSYVNSLSNTYSSSSSPSSSYSASTSSSSPICSNPAVASPQPSVDSEGSG